MVQIRIPLPDYGGLDQHTRAGAENTYLSFEHDAKPMSVIKAKPRTACV